MKAIEKEIKEIKTVIMLVMSASGIALIHEKKVNYKTYFKSVIKASKNTSKAISKLSKSDITYEIKQIELRLIFSMWCVTMATIYPQPLPNYKPGKISIVNQ